MTLTALGFVAMCGTNAPYADEWEFVPALLGMEPARPWLWAQHNEHRLPLSRAIYYSLFQFTHDFRAGMFFQVAMLSVLSLGLMRLAARYRGRADWPDAFFPISLLHVGHWENFVMGYQLCFVLFCVLVTGLAVVALRTTRATAFRSGLVAGALLIGVALTGGFGLAVVPPVAAWLAYLAAGVWRDGAKGRAVALGALAVVPVAYLAVYFVGYERPAHHPPPGRDPVAVAMVTAEVVAVGIGLGTEGIWWAVFAAEFLLGVATLRLVARDEIRVSTAGLVAVAAGVCGLALAVGIGRSPMGRDMGLWSRYSLLAWPLLGAAYLVWVRAGRKRVPSAMCAVAALAFPTNMGTGIMMGSSIRTNYSAIETAAQAGLSAEEIVRREFPNGPNAAQADRGAVAIPLLRAAKIGSFAEERSMGERNPWWVGGVVVGIVLLVLGARWVWHLGRAVQVERARELFRLQHERFEEQLLKAAAATGLPRGLTWESCAITGSAVIVRDTATGGIVALVPVLLQFEPVAGSDMEDVPAARDPRPATAVFTFARFHWETTGRVVFNHTPEQTIARFAPQFRVLGQGHH